MRASEAARPKERKSNCQRDRLAIITNRAPFNQYIHCIAFLDGILTRMSETLAAPRVTKSMIVDSLREFGVLSGAGVMVHSSLKSFGIVEGGARVVVEALMEVVGPSGTLMMPSFNHARPFEVDPFACYDPSQTPTSNGAIPDLFWRMPGVLRSLDPTHPIAAWGRNAARYTRFHHRTLTMGADSPLGMLWRDGGYGLLLGVGYGANTFHHVVETTTAAPCLGVRSEAYPVCLPDGRRVLGRTWGWRAAACPITDEVSYQAEMQARGLQRQVRIGGCQATLFRLDDCYRVIAAMLRDGLGNLPPCSRCPIRPRRVPWTVSSDWDPLNQRPWPDSVAWTY
jgi:aminoglycoside N3'-acetyltransferase